MPVMLLSVLLALAFLPALAAAGDTPRPQRPTASAPT